MAKVLHKWSLNINKSSLIIISGKQWDLSEMTNQVAYSIPEFLLTKTSRNT